MKDCYYNNDIPCSVIYSSHILMGIFFAYIGYLMIEGKKIDKWISISLVVIGVLALLYHSHLWYSKSKKN
jgi:multidrug transporter EmrE-like cation transporter